jgi:hypothetical protein
MNSVLQTDGNFVHNVKNIEQQTAVSEQQWHNEKFIAAFPFYFYYENR